MKISSSINQLVQEGASSGGSMNSGIGNKGGSMNPGDRNVKPKDIGQNF